LGMFMEIEVVKVGSTAEDRDADRQRRRDRVSFDSLP